MDIESESVEALMTKYECNMIVAYCTYTEG